MLEKCAIKSTCKEVLGHKTWQVLSTPAFSTNRTIGARMGESFMHGTSMKKSSVCILRSTRDRNEQHVHFDLVSSVRFKFNLDLESSSFALTVPYTQSLEDCYCPHPIAMVGCLILLICLMTSAQFCMVDVSYGFRHSRAEAISGFVPTGLFSESALSVTSVNASKMKR